MFSVTGHCWLGIQHTGKYFRTQKGKNCDLYCKLKIFPFKETIKQGTPYVNCFFSRLKFPALTGTGWKYHLKYIEKNWYSYWLSVHWTNRCQVTVIASYQATAVSWHLFVCCILRKEQKQSWSLYLIWHFHCPPYQTYIVQLAFFFCIIIIATVNSFKKICNEI